MKLLRPGWLLVSLFLALLANDVLAALTTWDPQGTGSAQPGSGAWENALWSTSQTGQATPVNWVEGSAALFAFGTSAATPAFTVTMNSTHTVAGIFNGALTPEPCSVTINGSGAIVLPAATFQGFAVDNISGDPGNTTINVPITGAATLVPEGSGQLYLNAVNTYSGGTLLGFHTAAFTGMVYFDNNSSFGTGPIWMTNGTGASLVAEGSSAMTIANAFQGTNLTLNIVGNPAGVTFSGPWNMTGVPVNTGAFNLSCGGAANYIVTLSGLVGGTNGFDKSGVGILALSGANTYGTANTSLGSTVVSGGALVLANASGSATGVSPVVVANSSSTLTGNGTATGTVNNSGSISATNMAGGTATLTTGAQTWAAGSIYQWAVNNVTGTAGTASGWDEIVINGGLGSGLSITATSGNPLYINIISLTAANQQGALAAFNNAQDYSWLILHSIIPIAGFSTNAVNINSGSFANSLGSGVFTVSTNNTSSGGDLFVNFIHTPVLSLSNVTVVEGSNAVFNASNTVTGSAPATAIYSWQSNNVPLSNGGRISGATTPTLTIANAQFADDATYTVIATNAAGSASASATLTATATATSVTWPTPSAFTYGTALGPTQLDATANLPGTFVYTPASGTVLNSGTYTLSVVFTPSNNAYSNATNTVSQVVLTAPLTATASNLTRPYGQANPTFTGTIAGLQNGDNITATYSCSATVGSPTGTYPIVPAFVDPNNRLTNYSTNFVYGTLDVGTILSWATPTAITYGTALGSSQLDATANVAGNFVYNPASGTMLNVGTYTLSTTFSPTDAADYDTTNASVSLAVSPAPLTVTAANDTRQAGTANPVFTGTISGLENNDNLTATYSTSATSASPAGTYAIVPALVDPNNRQTNYSVDLVGGTLTVTPPPAPITVSAPNIIPLPVTLSNRAGIFTLCPPQPATAAPSHASMPILVDGASQQTGQYLAAALFKSTGYQFQVVTSTATNSVKNAILITTSNAIPTLGAEGYELTVAPDSVLIRAPAQGGAFYGAQSLLQLLPPQIYSPGIITNVPWVAPCVYIKDYPLFSWRGVMLDVARHFFNKDEVKRVLDAMAMHKLNTFHWHLVDDQGWRLQMTNYPNLTVAGAWRASMDYGLPPRATTETNAAGQYGGYYTQAEAREVVAYAAERHITVVPEIEMPCHSTCALSSYPQFGCGNPVGDYDMDYPNIDYGVDLYSLGSPGTMAFLEDALTEVMGIFPGKYIHCGGDEVVSSGDTQWNSYTPDVTNMEANGITPNGTNSITKYQHWLSTNLANFLQANGRTMIAWTEFENGGILTNAALMDWEQSSSNMAVAVAEAGMPVVVTLNANCYINNLEIANTNLEPPSSTGLITVGTVYGFNPIFTNLPAQYNSNILGAQCSLWGEQVPSFENVMFKMFPREAALAEITWTPKALQSYSSFTNRLVAQKQRFVQMGLNYDHETIPQIGTWGPSVSTSPTTLNLNITTNVTTAGEIDVSFICTTGANGLSITSVALLVNGAQVDIDAHAGFAGNDATYTIYIVHLPETVRGANYTIQAVVQAASSTATSGIIYLPNWN